MTKLKQLLEQCGAFRRSSDLGLVGEYETPTSLFKSGNVIPLKKKPAPFCCEHCGIPIIEAYQIDLLFLCEECKKTEERAKAVKEMDID